MKMTVGILIGFIIGVVVGFLLCTNGVTVSPKEETNEATATQDTAPTTSESATTDAADISADQEITVDTSMLSSEQQALAEQFGLGDTQITITGEMLMCAEAEVGAERLNEIQNGATPTFMEGMALFGCYREQ